MLITKHDNNSNKHKTINFTQLVNDLELFTGQKQNRINLTHRLLNNECINIDDVTYNKKIGGF